MSSFFHLDRNFLSKPSEYNGIMLHQIGRRYTNGKTVIDFHRHKGWFELTIVLDGEGEIFTGTKSSKVKRGDIYLSLPTDLHKIMSDSINPLKYDYIAFSTEKDSLKPLLEQIKLNVTSPEKRLFCDGFISESVEKLIAEFGNKGLLADEFISCVLHQIVISVVRDFTSETKRKPLQVPKTPAEELCYTLMSYIDTNLYSIKNLRVLSKETGYNYSYLSALFRKTTSQTLYDYYRRKRLETAKTLITKENYTCEKVSELLNYSSASAFCKAFHAMFGVSPGKIRT